MTNLRKQIENLNNNMASQVPQDILAAFGQSIADLKQANIENRAPKVGETLLSFSLQNTQGESVELDKLLADNNKVVIAFFRGTWCPYCNLELRALQNALTKMDEKGVKLVAIAPQLQEFNKAVVEDNALTFDVLTDANNEYAKQLGIDFELQESVRPHYLKMGIDLKSFNGNDDNSLPMPAVFVVDKTKTIAYAFVDANYMNRVDIEELISIL